MNNDIERIRQEKKEILMTVINQINSFDNKSSILISVVGIMFALLLNFSSIYSLEAYIKYSNQNLKSIYIIVFIFFCASALFSLFSFIMVIIPRTHKKGNCNNVNYYKDLFMMTNEELNNNIDLYLKNDNILDNQILINAEICTKKHKWLKLGIVVLIPFSIMLILLIIGITFIFV